MLIALIGESCTGKSTIAAEITKILQAELFSGEDYLRFAKSETDAKAAFAARLLERALSTSEHVVYVISEPEHLPLLPEKCLRVLVTASLDTIKARFAARMGGKLPPPVEAMLVKKHGMFDSESRDLAICSDETEPISAAAQILRLLNR
jgi:ABC-type dipeptide/oligopeptide/nickel transport system ATPase component